MFKALIYKNKMDRIKIKDLKNYVEKEVKICGFVQKIRAQAKLKFLIF